MVAANKDATDGTVAAVQQVVQPGVVQQYQPAVQSTMEIKTGATIYTPDEDEAVAITAAISAYLAAEYAAAEAAMAAEEPLIVEQGADGGRPSRLIKPAPYPVAPLPIVMKTGDAVYTPDEDEAIAVMTAINAYLAAEDGAAPVSAEAPVSDRVWDARRPVAAPEPAPRPAPPPLPIVMKTGNTVYIPDDDEATAVFAAISAYLAAEMDAEELVDILDTWRPSWQASRVLLVQEAPLSRPVVRPGWNNIERLRRAGGGPSGIVGL